MSDKFVFQNAKVKHMELKLLTSQSLQRLLEISSASDAYRALIDLGFGAGAVLENGDFDKLFEFEEGKLVDFLKEFNVANALDPFIIAYDYVNFKALLKANIQEAKAVTLSLPGLYDVDTLKGYLQGVKENINPFMDKAINEVETLIGSGKLKPHLVDAIVDKAMYENIFNLVKKSGKLAKEYFTKKVDYANICTFIRIKKLKLDIQFFKDCFIEGGELKMDLFISIFDSALDLLKDKCKDTAYGKLVSKYVDDLDLVSFEVSIDNELFKMWKDERDDLFSISPMVSFYLEKNTELKVVKLIVAGIRNKVDSKLIKERMRELYA